MQIRNFETTYAIAIISAEFECRKMDQELNHMIKIGIVGASGYGGGELLRLLGRHPKAKVTLAVSGTYAGKPVSSAWPGQWKQSDLIFSPVDDGTQLQKCNVVFLAMDNGKAMTLAPRLLDAGVKIVDLSADFRLKNVELYPEWYGFEHLCPKISDEAIFGLPELNRSEIKHARLIANPGCYPTAAILALAPLIENKAIRLETIILDGASGVSGAGRSKFSLDYHYPELNESYSAYKIAGTHRHTPEMEQSFTQLAQSEVKVTFTPHLAPMSRGILMTCYANLIQKTTTERLQAMFKERYESEPFVVIYEEGLPTTKHVLGSNRCHIGLKVDERTGRVVVISAIDNLVKGMAGQAIQNMNLLFGIEETAGLSDIGGLWP